MGICFIGKRNFTDFIHGYLPPSTKTGTYIDIDSGAIVGQYHSPSYLTIGQGAKISGASCKWFVAKVDKSQDVIYVCSDTHHPSLYSSELYVKLDDFNWIGGEIPLPLVCGKDMPALCRIRHLQPLITSNIIWDRKNHLLVLHFHNAVRAITPGQTVVIYAAKGVVCLGGGTIWKAGPTFLERNSTLPSVLHPSGHNDLSLKHFHNFKIRT
jgi:tRNA-specific 2-thiouridylase